jgi:hypothetical protein
VDVTDDASLGHGQSITGLPGVVVAGDDDDDVATKSGDDVDNVIVCLGPRIDFTLSDVGMGSTYLHDSLIRRLKGIEVTV